MEYLQRYLNGQHEQVWSDLHALGPAVRREPHYSAACAVAAETERRNCELRGDDRCRTVFAERVEVDGKCHILLAKQAWGPKDSLDTRWWSLVLDAGHRAYSVRTGSCGDPLTRADVPRVS